MFRCEIMVEFYGNKVLVCKHCGNIVKVVKESGVPMMCCGEKMSKIQANTSDGAMEKHVPEVEVNGEVVSEVYEYCNLHGLWKKHYIN